MGWQLFDEDDFDRFIKNTCKKEGTETCLNITNKKSNKRQSQIQTI
jgi:hypothetical protein